MTARVEGRKRLVFHLLSFFCMAARVEGRKRLVLHLLAFLCVTAKFDGRNSYVFNMLELFCMTVCLHCFVFLPESTDVSYMSSICCRSSV